MNVLSSSHCWGLMLIHAKKIKKIDKNKFLTNYFQFFCYLFENEQKSEPKESAKNLGVSEVLRHFVERYMKKSKP